MRLVLASLNAHKLTEIRALLAGLPLDVVGLDAFPAVPEPPETGATFEDNALQKAVFVAEATGLPALADDSGLAVDALGGAPGVHSKRFSPEGTAAANNALLLARLAPHTDRRARFVCVLALAGPGSEVNLTHDALASEIGSAREVVSRQLSRFERSGLVALARGKVTLLARGTLERKAAGG